MCLGAKLCLGVLGDAPLGWLTLNVGKSFAAASSQIRCCGSASFVNLYGEAVNVSSVNLYRNDLKKIRVIVGHLKLPPDD